MRDSIVRGAVLAITLIGGACALPACSDQASGGGTTPSTERDESPVGSLGLALSLANGEALNSVSYVITGPAGFAKAGTIDVSKSTKIAATIAPLPAAHGYSVALSGDASGGTKCAGVAGFDISAGQTTRVTVRVVCHEPPRAGSVAVNGQLNLCPVVDGISATPSEVLVGSSVALSAEAHDSDAGPGPLHYQWSAPSGKLSDPTAQKPTFTCTSAGPVTVTVTVSDGDPSKNCPDTMDVVVTCSVDEALAKPWRAVMASTPLPRTGCFKAAYPSTVWQAVPCSTAPNTPFGPTPQAVGNGADFSAVSTGIISQAVGSFDSITGLTSIDSRPTGGVGPFSLQVNANFFTTTSCGAGCTACAGGCTGWQQFVFDGDSRPFRGPSAYMQYWLVGFTGACPSGWNTASGSGCFRNSTSVGIPGPLNEDLAHMTLVGRATTSMDTIILSTAGGDLSAVGADNVVGLQPNWNTAEFNVFGDGNSSTAAINAGTTMVVRTAITDGTSNAPACIGAGTTAEQNTLDLAPPCCTVGGAEPAIVFTQSNVAGTVSSCAGGACTQGLQVLADTVVSSGADCFGTSHDFDFGPATCDAGFERGSCSAMLANDGSNNGSTCTATPTGDCGCHVHLTTPADCGKGASCHVLVTEQPTSGPVPQLVTNDTGHNGSDCFGTSHDFDFPAACSAGFTLGDCSAHLITSPNGSTCTATPIGDCGCRLHITTPADCFKFATCAIEATQVPADWTPGCSTLSRF